MEFELDGHTYRSSRLNAKQQFHLARRLAPLFTAIQAQSHKEQLFETLAGAVAEMSDEQCNIILDTCLCVVQRQQGKAWAKVFDERSQSLMFDDIDMKTMLGLAQKVIEENLGGFFGGKDAPDIASPAPVKA